jgi:hypothetical protein
MTTRTPKTRREFLADVGRGALLVSVGAGLSSELGLRWAVADEEPEPLSFGPLEPLVALMQETSIDRLLPELVVRLRTGTELRTLVAAAALANARTFGGEDYVGFHAMMALAPAYRIALESPEASRPLPVLKVLYRNGNRIQEVGGRRNEVLRRADGTAPPEGRSGADALRDAVHAKDMAGAERAFAAQARAAPAAAIDALLPTVEDTAEVHRVVLASRAWEMVDLVGREHAHTLLRQSVRYCVKEEGRVGSVRSRARDVLPLALEKHGLLGRAPGNLPAEDDWVERTSRSIFEATPEEAADVAAAALAAGRAPEALGEAIALAANQLVLRDAGRPEREARPEKPAGSVHGDSIGVHACDSVHAWRNLARAGSPRHLFACLILAAYQTAHERTARGGQFLEWRPRPLPEELARVESRDPEALLRDLDAAVRENGQAAACAVVHRYGELGHPPRPVLDLLVRYATSEDGALHAEKYYRTATDEFAATRPAFRWRHLVALARVTASEFGHPAPGLVEARRLLQG